MSAIPGEAWRPRPIDASELRDTGRCPSCAAAVSAPRCANCGLDLALPELDRVFRLGCEAADLLDERARLLGDLLARSRAAVEAEPLALSPSAIPRPMPPPMPMAAPSPLPSASSSLDESAPVPGSWAVPGGGAVPTPAPAPAPAPPPALEAAPTLEPPSVRRPPRRLTPQTILLGTGVVFLGIAALVFLTVAFVLFDLTVKALIVGGVTAAVIALATVLRRRELTASAEGISALGMVLLGLDAWAARATGLIPESGLDTAVYWGLALLTLAAVGIGWGAAARLRLPRFIGVATIVPGLTLLGTGLARPAAPQLVPIVLGGLVAGLGAALPLGDRRRRLPEPDAALLAIPTLVVGAVVPPVAFSMMSSEADGPFMSLATVLVAAGMTGMISFLAPRPTAFLRGLAVPAAILLAIAWLVALFFASVAFDGFDTLPAFLPLGFIVPFGLAVAWLRNGPRAPMIAGTVTTGLALTAILLIDSTRWSRLVAARVSGDELDRWQATSAVGGAVGAVLGAAFILIALRLLAPGAARRRLVLLAAALAFLGLLVAAYFVDAGASPFLLAGILTLTVAGAVWLQRRAPRGTSDGAVSATRRDFIDAAQFLSAIALAVSVDATTTALLVVLAGIAALFSIRLAGDLAPAGAATFVGLGLAATLLVLVALPWSAPELIDWTSTIALGAAALPIATVPFLRRGGHPWMRAALGSLAAALLVVIAAAGAATDSAAAGTAGVLTTLLLAIAVLGLILVVGRTADRRAGAAGHMEADALSRATDTDDSRSGAVVDDPLRIAIGPLVTIGAVAALELAGFDGWAFAGTLAVTLGALAVTLDAAIRRRTGPDRTSIGEALGLVALIPVAVTLVALASARDLAPRDLIALVLLATTACLTAWAPGRPQPELWRHLVPWAAALTGYLVGLGVVPSLWDPRCLALEVTPAVLVAAITAVAFGVTPRSATALGRAMLAVTVAAGLVPLYATLLISSFGGDCDSAPASSLAISLAVLLVAAFWPRAPRFQPMRTTAATLSGFAAPVALLAVIDDALPPGSEGLSHGWIATLVGTTILVALVLAHRTATTRLASLATTAGVLLGAAVPVFAASGPIDARLLVRAAVFVAVVLAAAVAERAGRHRWAPIAASLGALLFVLDAVRPAGFGAPDVGPTVQLPSLIATMLLGLAAAVIAVSTASRAHRGFLATLALIVPAPVGVWLAAATVPIAIGQPRLLVAAAGLVALGAGVVAVLRRNRPDSLALVAGIAAVPLPLVAMITQTGESPVWLLGVAVSASSAAIVLLAPALPAALGAHRHHVSLAAQLALALGGLLVLVGGIPDAFVPLTLLPTPIAALGSCIWFLSAGESRFADPRRPAPVVAAMGTAWLGLAPALWTSGPVVDGTTLALLGVLPLAAALVAIVITRTAPASALDLERRRTVAAAIGVVGLDTLVLAACALRVDPERVGGTLLALLLPLAAAALLALALITLGRRGHRDRLGLPGLFATIALTLGIAAAPLWWAVDAARSEWDAVLPGLLGPLLIAITVLVAQFPLVAVGRRAAPSTSRTAEGVALAAAVGSALAALALPTVRIDAPIEWPLLPLAFGLLAWGVSRMRLDPATRSRVFLAPGVAVALIPSLIAEAAEPTLARIILVTVLVVAAICWGAFGRLQAPLLLGGAAALVHAVIAVRTALPDLVVPWWVWLAIAGVVLVTLAITYEARMRDLRRLRVAIDALR